MKSPKIKKTRIGGSYYDVKYVKNLKDEKGRVLFGRIWQATHIIEIDNGNCYQSQLQALFHENIHGICWEYAIDDDEDFVEPISNGVFAFIMNNKKLIKEILRCAEGIK